MGRHTFWASGLTVAALFGAAASAAIVVDPVYTFCETEDNDIFVNAQEFNAQIAVDMNDGDEDARDCFMLTGKLQQDCIFDVRPKCLLLLYGKHLQCYTSNGQIILGEFYEPELRRTNSSGEILNYPIPAGDRVLRIAISASPDGNDGTVNGLAQNSPHQECGEVTVKVFYNGITDRGTPDDMYTFHFDNGSDAARVAFVAPPGATSASIICCNDTGQFPICHDVDHYRLTGLLPGRPYCLTVVGGADDWCFKTDTLLVWLDKDGQLQDFDDDGAFPNALDRIPQEIDDDVYSHLCVQSEGATTDPMTSGIVRFAVTGGGHFPKCVSLPDDVQVCIINGTGFAVSYLPGRDLPPDGPSFFRDLNLNGQIDRLEKIYRFIRTFLSLNEPTLLPPFDGTYRPGASIKELDTIGDVPFYPRSIWDEYHFPSLNRPGDFPLDFDIPYPGFPCVRFPPEFFFQHFKCGEYCIKVQLAQHVPPGERPQAITMPLNATMADLNHDGVINSFDLATMLSHWGVLPGQ